MAMQMQNALLVLGGAATTIALHLDILHHTLDQKIAPDMH